MLLMLHSSTFKFHWFVAAPDRVYAVDLNDHTFVAVMALPAQRAQ